MMGGVTALVRHLRAAGRRYALVLAMCQLAVVVSATAVLLSSPQFAGLTVAAGDECECDHATAVMCPMHRKTSSRPVPADAPRWCKGVDGATYAVMPVLGALAPPERLAQLALLTALSPIASSPDQAPLALDRPPDSPPPRL
jgi:hypothetical protein